MKKLLTALCLTAVVVISYQVGIYDYEASTDNDREVSLQNVSDSDTESNNTHNTNTVLSKKDAQAQNAQKIEKVTPEQLKELNEIQAPWTKRYPNARITDKTVKAERRKVGIKRNIRVVVRETLFKTDMKYANIVGEEVYSKNGSGNLELASYVEYVADHILIKINNEENVIQLKENFKTIKVDKVDKTDDNQLYMVKLNGEDIDTVKNAIASYEENKNVQYAEKDYVLNSSSNDTYFSNLWGLNNVGQNGGTADADIDAPEAWSITRGSTDVLVAIIDTGIDYNHSDLAANMWTNPGETGTDSNGNDKATNGVDDDSNGYVDDVRGWDFVNNDNDSMDDHSHGTHCAGTIGAVGDNNVGVIGVAPEVRMVGLKFLSAGGSGYLSDAVKAILYSNKIGVDISSNSWGGGGYSQSLKDAIDASADRNILFVAAAGNSGRNTDSSPAYPASYSSANIVSVAATDRNDGIASFSNYGVNSVDMGAPGVSILSTTPGNNYSYYSGTSMACPHVSGAAVLLKANNNGMTVADMKNALMYKSDAISSLNGRSASGSRLNIFKALSGEEEDDVEPAIITSPVNGSEFTDANVTFSWDADDAITDLEISIGSSFGAADHFSSDALENLSEVTVTLPEDGSRLYVRLRSMIDDEWVHRDTSYIASNKDIPPPSKSELTAPVSSTVLKAGTTVFQWTSGSQVERRFLYVGTRKGYGNLYRGYVGESGVSANLNIFTSKTYVRLWSRLEGRWQYEDSVFDSISSVSAMVSPANGTKLTSANVTFEWTEGYNIRYRYLYVGSSKGRADIYRSYVTGTSKEVVTPTDGRTVYVRLWSYINGGGWQYKDYNYTSAIIAPEVSLINSHKDGEIFNSESVDITWTDGVGVNHNYLYMYSNKTYRRVFSGRVYNNEQNIVVPEGSGQVTAYFYSYMNGRWNRSTYLFYAKGSAPKITAPISGSHLYESSVTFKWDNPTGVRYNYMMIGTRPGGSNLYRAFLSNSTEKTININVGGKIYVRLYTYNNGWSYSDSVYYK
jgi:subtilisin family serine protease